MIVNNCFIWYNSFIVTFFLFSLQHFLTCINVSALLVCIAVLIRPRSENLKNHFCIFIFQRSSPPSTPPSPHSTLLSISNIICVPTEEDYEVINHQRVAASFWTHCHSHWGHQLIIHFAIESSENYHLMLTWNTKRVISFEVANLPFGSLPLFLISFLHKYLFFNSLYFHHFICRFLQLVFCFVVEGGNHANRVWLNPPNYQLFMSIDTLTKSKSLSVSLSACLWIFSSFHCSLGLTLSSLVSWLFDVERTWRKRFLMYILHVSINTCFFQTLTFSVLSTNSILVWHRFDITWASPFLNTLSSPTFSSFLFFFGVVE